MEFIKLFTQTNTASTLFYLAIVAIAGILFGKIKIVKIKLGIAGVLFAGLLAGHLGVSINHNVLHFVKEFGLILFVYSIGISIGPRFFSSFRKNGLKLNMLSAMIVVFGFLTAFALKHIFNLETPVITGILCGSVTNTPSLGAAQQLITEQFANGSSLAEVTGMGYAVAYPFGIIGIILVMISIRVFFKIKINKEIELYNNDNISETGKAETVNITVQNPNVFGKPLSFLKTTLNKEFVFSRLMRKGEFIVPDDKITLEKDDVLIGLSSKKYFPQLELTVGKIEINKKYELATPLTMRHIVITNRKITGRKLADINLSGMFPANITRIWRCETEIIPNLDTTLEFGDTVRVVGARNKMPEIAKFLGNSLRDLSHPNLTPLFIGISLGILLGSIPIFIPGLPAPAKLGLAGGPLIIALLLGYKGRIGNFNFYLTPGANLFIRELGIVLFLACVGLGSGKHFWETITGGGYIWMLYGAIITFFPLMIVGIIGRFMKLNYLSLCGILAGSMTDPPALEFANSIAPSQAQASAYATVYPLTMFLRILLAQILVLIT
jgi:putative transport protein